LGDDEGAELAEKPVKATGSTVQQVGHLLAPLVMHHGDPCLAF